MTSEKGNKQYQKDTLQKDRRSFLKKAVYTTPAILVLGQLARPTQAKAWGDPGEIPSQPSVP